MLVIASLFPFQLFTCDCHPGYTGSFCESDIEECASDPCMNQATCVENSHNEGVNHQVAAGYSCLCAPGYTGREYKDYVYSYVVV